MFTVRCSKPATNTEASKPLKSGFWISTWLCCPVLPPVVPQVRDLYWTFRNFQTRVRDFLRYRRLTGGPRGGCNQVAAALIGRRLLCGARACLCPPAHLACLPAGLPTHTGR